MDCELGRSLLDFKFEDIAQVEQMIKSYMFEHGFTSMDSIHIVKYIGDVGDYVVTFSHDDFENDIDVHAYINNNQVVMTMFYPAEK